MDAQKFTQKSLSTIQNAQNIAIEKQNAQIEQEHLLFALINDNDSLIKELFTKMNVEEKLEKMIEECIDKMPKISGSARPNGNMYVSQDVDLTLVEAEKIASAIRRALSTSRCVFLFIKKPPLQNNKPCDKLTSQG